MQYVCSRCSQRWSGVEGAAGESCPSCGLSAKPALETCPNCGKVWDEHNFSMVMGSVSRSCPKKYSKTSG